MSTCRPLLPEDYDGTGEAILRHGPLPLQWASFGSPAETAELLEALAGTGPDVRVGMAERLPELAGDFLINLALSIRRRVI